MSDNDDIAVSMTDSYDTPYVEFLSALLEWKIDFLKAVKKVPFKELNQLNNSRWQGYVPNNEVMNGLLIAGIITEYDVVEVVVEDP